MGSQEPHSSSPTPSPQKKGEDMVKKQLVGEDKDREKGHQLQSQADCNKGDEWNVYCLYTRAV